MHAASHSSYIYHTHTMHLHAYIVANSKTATVCIYMQCSYMCMRHNNITIPHYPRGPYHYWGILSIIQEHAAAPVSGDLYFYIMQIPTLPHFSPYM